MSNQVVELDNIWIRRAFQTTVHMARVWVAGKTVRSLATDGSYLSALDQLGIIKRYRNGLFTLLY